jgi:hypothetical protein
MASAAACSFYDGATAGSGLGICGIQALAEDVTSRRTHDAVLAKLVRFSYALGLGSELAPRFLHRLHDTAPLFGSADVLRNARCSPRHDHVLLVFGQFAGAHQLEKARSLLEHELSIGSRVTAITAVLPTGRHGRKTRNQD